MKKEYNLKSIIAGLVILICGIGMVLLDVFLINSSQNLWISIGCSLIASAIVILVNAWLVERKEVNPLEKWKISKIYKRRSEKSADSDTKIKKVKNNLDVVAFGLKSFRENHSADIQKCLNNGTIIRILTMSPNSIFVSQREKEENETEGQIKNTINGLIEWAKDINAKVKKTKNSKKAGHIEIRGYDCMTLDFYWRMDNELYVGPYWYGMSSQQTITYKFDEGGEGFKDYTDYFEKIWRSAEGNVLL